jgi:hypothetical protein
VNEAFDSSWTANVNGERIEPKYLYLTTTGFYINKTGKLEITIEYEPQNLFYICFFAAVAALGLCCAFLGKNRIKALFKGRLLRMPYSSN